MFTVRDDALQVLLVRRGAWPYEGMWALPGGFVRSDADANLDRAAERILREKTGVGIDPVASVSAAPDDIHLEQLRAYWRQGRDPRLPTATVAFLAIGPDLPEPTASSNTAAAEWRPVDDVLAERVALAFDHAQIVRDAVAEVRRRLQTTMLATRFVPRFFTLAQLRHVYEAIWGQPLDKGNFYREVKKLVGLIEPTGEYAPSGGGRPAELYAVRGMGELEPQQIYPAL